VAVVAGATSSRDGSVASAAVLLATAAGVLVADQLTKALVVANLEFGAREEVLGDVVQLWHVRNTGAAFSLFPGATWLFVPMAIAALAMVGYLFSKYRGRVLWLHVVLGAIVGGTLGNLVDRVRHGYVVDFVSVGVGDLRWPTFNVADSSLVIGIGLLVIFLTSADRVEPGTAAG
jgi:signal peptidase II